MVVKLDLQSLVASYGDPLTEARNCRETCALFDFSFVHRVTLSGPLARDCLQHFMYRDLRQLSDRQICYGVVCDQQGWLKSDLTVWQHSAEHYEVMSGDADDVAALLGLPNCHAQDLSARTAIFAVQGPDTLKRLSRLDDVSGLVSLAYYRWTRTSLTGIDCIIGRLGYTGETGIEIIVDAADADRLWTRLAEVVEPAGFAAADILRIEAGFCLFANDFAIPVTPAEAGLGAFVGREVSLPAPRLRRVAFTAEAVSRPVLWQPGVGLSRDIADHEITITSASQSTMSDKVIGLGYVCGHGSQQLQDPTGAFANVELQHLPLFDPHKRRPRQNWRI